MRICLKVKVYKRNVRNVGWIFIASIILIIILAFVYLSSGHIDRLDRPSPEIFSAIPDMKVLVEESKHTQQATIEKIDKTSNSRWVSDVGHSSLAGSKVDRAYVIGSNGEFVLSPGILLYFDYFLSLSGEMDPQRITDIVLADIRNNYSKDIASQLSELFLRYQRYLLAISQRLDDLNFIEAFWLGINKHSLEAEVQPLYFSNEEIESLFVAYTLMLERGSRSSRYSKKYDRIEQLNEDPEMQQAVVTELFGAEAAGRMHALRQQELEWQQRLARFNDEKDVIVLSTDLDDYAKKEALQLLLERSFSGAERIRVMAINGLDLY